MRLLPEASLSLRLLTLCLALPILAAGAPPALPKGEFKVHILTLPGPMAISSPQFEKVFHFTPKNLHDVILSMQVTGEFSQGGGQANLSLSVRDNLRSTLAPIDPLTGTTITAGQTLALDELGVPFHLELTGIAVATNPPYEIKFAVSLPEPEPGNLLYLYNVKLKIFTLEDAKLVRNSPQIQAED